MTPPGCTGNVKLHRLRAHLCPGVVLCLTSGSVCALISVPRSRENTLFSSSLMPALAMAFLHGRGFEMMLINNRITPPEVEDRGAVFQLGVFLTERRVGEIGSASTKPLQSPRCSWPHRRCVVCFNVFECTCGFKRVPPY